MDHANAAAAAAALNSAYAAALREGADPTTAANKVLQSALAGMRALGAHVAAEGEGDPWRRAVEAARRLVELVLGNGAPAPASAAAAAQLEVLSGALLGGMINAPMDEAGNSDVGSGPREVCHKVPGVSLGCTSRRGSSAANASRRGCRC